MRFNRPGADTNSLFRARTRLGQRHQSALAYREAANALTLLPPSVAEPTWSDLPLGRPCCDRPKAEVAWPDFIKYAPATA
jgi:hypothetical protein